MERLQKVLAAAGLGSRRQCEELVLDGRVEVDGEIVTRLGTKVDPERQAVRVDGEPLHLPERRYVMLHKPEGVVSTARDPSGRPRVIDLVPPELGRLFSVGRLDKSSEGLILLTNDGELANRLAHPRYGVEKVYEVQVAGRVEQDVVQQLRKGIYLAEGLARVKNIRIKSRRKQSTILEMVLDEGRNREIRRVLAKVGHKVQRLRRIAIGPLRLGDLPVGAYRPLKRDEMRALRASVSGGGRRGARKSSRKSAKQGEPGSGASRRKKKKMAGSLKQSGRGRPSKGKGRRK